LGRSLLRVAPVAMVPDQLHPAVVPVPRSGDVDPETIGGIPGIERLPQLSVLMHPEAEKPFLTHHPNDLTREVLGSLYLLEGDLVAVDASGDLRVGPKELNHLICLTLLADELGDEQHAKGEAVAVEFLGGQVFIKPSDIGANACR
jgi:hypothetical protein